MPSHLPTPISQLLSSHFATLAETPDAVAKLRNFVLSLAVRGQLLPQNSADEKPAQWNDFITNFADANTPGEEPPFKLPKSWRWVRLNDVADYAAADKVDPSEIKNDDWVLDLEEIEKDTSRIVRMATFAEKQSSSTKAKFLPGDVLYGKLRPYLNKVVVAQQGGFCTTEIVPIRSRGLIEPTYLCVYLRSPDFVGYANSKSYGMKMPRLGTDDAVSAWIAVPPPAEQRRIVAKVEDLLALCDELEARQTAAREHRTNLVRSALDHLTTAQTDPEFRQHAAFVLQHSDLVLDSVSTLRQAINSLAIEGRLLPQNAQDEPAETLLARIRSTKHRLAESAGSKPPKDWPAIQADDLPFSLPKNWVESRLGELAIDIEAGFSPQCEGRPKEKKEWGVLKISAVSWDEFDPDENKALPANVEPRPELEVRDGDFIMSRANTADLVAKSVVTSKPPPRLLLNDKTLRVHFTEHTDKRFLNMVNNSSVSRTYYAKAASGTSSSMKNITRDGISMLPIALPPLAEQQRIVAKVDELMRWCDALEARLTTAETAATNLLDATLHQILAA